MTLRLYHAGNPERLEAVVFCDVGLTDDCSALVELGERPGWTVQQFRDLAQSSEYGWRFDARTGRYLCPPCQHVDDHRRQPAVLAGEGFSAPFRSQQPDPDRDRGSDESHC
jgi:hypothetical protein